MHDNYYYRLSIPNLKTQNPKCSKILNFSSVVMIPQVENSRTDLTDLSQSHNRQFIRFPQRKKKDLRSAAMFSDDDKQGSGFQGFRNSSE